MTSLANPRPLTPSEFKIYLLTVEWAMSPEDIALKLGCSAATVRKHLSRMFVKLGVRSSLEMLVEYHRNESCGAKE